MFFSRRGAAAAPVPLNKAARRLCIALAARGVTRPCDALELSPSELSLFVRALRARDEQEAQSAHLTGAYTLLAVHAPARYPQTPFEPTKAMTPRDIKRVFLAMTKEGTP